jgi:proteasome accessory factor B
MSDNKTERLINLTIALLGSRRYVSKSEIFHSVAGYDGSPETMERMFERDKDELRQLGVEIEVGSHDALFEDELGYRISRDSYGLDLGDLSAQELSLLSLAGQLWRSEVLSSAGVRALSKIDGTQAQTDLGTTIVMDDVTSEYFEPILAAIESRGTTAFTYEAQVISKRSVEPYELILWRGFWYLIGRDIDKSEIRTFKLNRISGKLSLSKKGNLYGIPENFDARKYLTSIIQGDSHLVALKARKERAGALRIRGSVTPLDSEWDLIEFHDGELYTLASQVLWHGSDVIAIEPQELREIIVRRLQEKEL